MGLVPSLIKTTSYDSKPSSLSRTPFHSLTEVRPISDLKMIDLGISFFFYCVARSLGHTPVSARESSSFFFFQKKRSVATRPEGEELKATLPIGEGKIPLFLLPIPPNLIGKVHLQLIDLFFDVNVRCLR